MSVPGPTRVTWAFSAAVSIVGPPSARAYSTARNGGRIPGHDDPGDRTAAGARAAPAHVPPDGEDSRLRGAGERAVQGREDAGAGPPLYRRGGRGGRGLRGPAPRRLHHQHPPRPPPLPCPGRPRPPDDRPAARQGGG